jgi:hypothetical protein
LAASYIARELRPAFYDGRALREATDLPLLGVVSLALTPTQASQRRRGLALFAGGAGALVACYMLAFVMLEFLLAHPAP